MPCTATVLRTVVATRYVTPLREGSSLPALVEADDAGMYVLKLRGAGQGLKALVAELLAGEVARILGLPVPEIVLIELDAELARHEPEALVRNLVHASSGVNLALDYLPGSTMFGPRSAKPDGTLASRIVWFDAFVSNPDRTPRNTNILVWHDKVWLIDHGAALYFHHQWDGFLDRAQSPFTLVKNHVLLPLATQLQEVDAEMSARLTPEVLKTLGALVPDVWMTPDPAFPDVAAQRQAYVDYFVRRVQGPRHFMEEAARAHDAMRSGVTECGV